MSLGADLAKAVFGHRTHVARTFDAPQGCRRAKGHMVANTSGLSLAESGRPTPPLQRAAPRKLRISLTNEVLSPLSQGLCKLQHLWGHEFCRGRAPGGVGKVVGEVWVVAPDPIEGVFEGVLGGAGGEAKLALGA